MTIRRSDLLERYNFQIEVIKYPVQRHVESRAAHRRFKVTTRDCLWQCRNAAMSTSPIGNSLAVWRNYSCASLASTCDAYVEAKLGPFAPAHWLINSLKVC
jgi:hypothetical protein